MVDDIGDAKPEMSLREEEHGGEENKKNGVLLWRVHVIKVELKRV